MREQELNKKRVKELGNKWYDFDDYKENDYREVFNYEALYIDHTYGDMIALNQYALDDILEELNQNINDVLLKVVKDIKAVGFKKISMLGYGMTVEEWEEDFTEGVFL